MWNFIGGPVQHCAAVTHTEKGSVCVAVLQHLLKVCLMSSCCMTSKKAFHHVPFNFLLYHCRFFQMCQHGTTKGKTWCAISNAICGSSNRGVSVSIWLCNPPVHLRCRVLPVLLMSLCKPKANDASDRMHVQVAWQRLCNNTHSEFSIVVRPHTSAISVARRQSQQLIVLEVESVPLTTFVLVKLWLDLDNTRLWSCMCIKCSLFELQPTAVDCRFGSHTSVVTMPASSGPYICRASLSLP